MDVDTNALIDKGIDAGVEQLTSNPEVKRLGSAMASGAAMGATFGSVFPGLGNVVGGAIGTIAGAVAALVPMIAGALHGQCTITIKGLDTDCRDYPRNVAVAAKWLHENPTAALHLSPEAFSAQAHVLAQDFGEWYRTLAPNYQERIRDSGALGKLDKLPGARTLLRVAQLPAAAALVAATPNQAAMHRAALTREFPALSSADVETVIARAKARPAPHPHAPTPPPPRALPAAPHVTPPVKTPAPAPRPAVASPPAPAPLPWPPPTALAPPAAAAIEPPRSAGGGGAVVALGIMGAGLLLFAVAQHKRTKTPPNPTRRKPQEAP